MQLTTVQYRADVHSESAGSLTHAGGGCRRHVKIFCHPFDLRAHSRAQLRG